MKKLNLYGGLVLFAVFLYSGYLLHHIAISHATDSAYHAGNVSNMVPRLTYPEQTKNKSARLERALGKGMRSGLQAMVTGNARPCSCVHQMNQLTIKC